MGYRCVTARRSTVLIGQSNFNGAGRSKDCRNDLASLSSAARTRTTAMRFTLNVNSLMTGVPPFLTTAATC
jgi:hypothetical protein